MPDRKPEFPTPWRVVEKRETVWVVDANGHTVCEADAFDETEVQKRAMDRIVAAVNAVGGTVQ